MASRDYWLGWLFFQVNKNEYYDIMNHSCLNLLFNKIVLGFMSEKTNTEISKLAVGG